MKADSEPESKPKAARGAGDDAEPTFKVQDRRHWAGGGGEDSDDAGEPTSTHPTLLDEYKNRAEAAERKLHEYIAAFKDVQAEQEAFRSRLARDVERRVDLRFAELISELLATVDDLDLALSHVEGVGNVRPLADGVALARDRFLAVLEKHGVEKIDPRGEEFDPNVAEAVRMDPVSDPALHGRVIELLRPGYRLGDRIVRAAQVSVGRSSE